MVKSIRKTTLAFLLAFLLCLVSAIVGFVLISQPAARAEVEPWDGDLIAAGWGEEADKVTPADYVVTTDGDQTTVTIGSAAALAYFAHEVYIDTEHKLDNATVKLTADINLADKIWIPIGQTDRSNDPARRFSGVFDGQGHTISNLNTDDYFANLKYSNGNYHIEYARTDGKTANIPFAVKSNEEYSYGLFGVASNITVRNLTVKGVNISASEMTYDGAPKKLLPDSFGAIIGYCTSNVTLENCVAGSLETNDVITASTDNNGSYGGLVGRIYSGTNNADAVPLGNVLFNQCISYVDFNLSGKSSKIGGIVGYAQFFERCVIKNCVNYGDIDGGQFVGGITSYWSNQITNYEGVQHFEISHCDNFGNISAVQDIGTNGRDTAGIIGQLRGADSNSYVEHCQIRIIVSGCNNYGNISSEERVGGIISWYRNTSGINATITDNYNYGNVYEYGTAPVGGYIGTYHVHRGDADLAGELTTSGGNLGTVYGAGDNTGSNFGSYGLNFTGNTDHDRLNELFYVDAGKAVKTDIDKIPEASTEHSTATHTRYDLTAAVDDDTFKYSGADKKTIIGFADGVTVPETVTIPATVEKIGVSAFVGQSGIKTVTFAKNSVLSEIGDWAFAGTGITEIELPDSVTSIGAAAFGDCASLKKVALSANLAEIGMAAFGNAGMNYIELPEALDGAALTYGERVFGSNVYVIAANGEQATALDGFADIVTHKITVEYYDLSTSATTPADTELKLAGQSYNVWYNRSEDKWETRTGSGVGTSKLGYTSQWYSDGELNNLVANAEAAEELLTGNVKLYARALNVAEEFIPADNIVYDPSKSYTATTVNALLATNSKKVTNETVKITAKGSAEPLETINNAGVYTVTITDKDNAENVSEIDVTVRQAPVDITNINSLVWRINGTASLLDGTVYVSEDDEVSLAQTDGYTAKRVINSIARLRDKNASGIKLSLAVDGATVSEDVAKTTTGVYRSVFTVTLDGNHAFAATEAYADVARGIEITFDGNTATVVKTWYLVEMDNGFTLGGKPYAIANRNYGEGGFVLPAFERGSLDESGTISFTLTGTTAEGQAISQTFNHTAFNRYMNKLLPAGSYTLVMTATGVTYKEGEGADEIEIKCAPFSQSVTFAVSALELSNNDFVKNINNALNGNTFEFILGEKDDRYGSVKTAVDTACEELRNTKPVDGTVTDNYWTTNNTVDFVLSYNYVSDMTNVYTTVFPDLTVSGVYTFYYKVSANNYISAETDETNKLLSFNVIAYKRVGVPTVESKPYNGAVQTAEMLGTADYTVTANAGGTSAGEYDVTLTLVNAYGIWSGQTIDERTESLTLKFEITQAENTWTTSPEVLGWDYNSFDKEINRIYGAAKFTSTNNGVWFKVTTDNEGKNAVKGLEKFEVGKNGVVENEEIIKLLNGLFVGNYYLTATVGETNNFTGIETTLNLKVDLVSNGWSDAEDAIKLPSWIVGEYNEKDNPISVKPKYGSSVIVIKDMDGNEYYNSETGVNKLKDAPIGKYLLSASVKETNNYAGLAERTFTIEVFAKAGLAWWVTLIIVIAVLAVVALTLFILWKKGIIQLLTDKIALAIRTRATVDATIASVRAAKKMEEGKKSVAAAKRKEAAEARKAKAQEERNKPAEEKAAMLEEKARQAAERAERMRARAEAMQARAERMREQAQPKEEEKTEEPEKAEPQAEAAATEEEN